MVLDCLTSADRAHLLEVYGRSVSLLELGRPKEWAELFLPNAVVQRGGRDAVQQFKGRDELQALARRIGLGEFDIALGAAPPARRHWLSNISLFEDGPKHVLGFATVAVIGIGGEAPRWLATGTYSDRLHKLPSGCWCFESRTFVVDGSAARDAQGRGQTTMRATPGMVHLLD